MAESLADWVRSLASQYDQKLNTRPCGKALRRVAEEMDGLRAENARYRVLVKELADHLEAWIDDYYPEDTREKYPSQKRRYERDMKPVRTARAALESEG